MSSPILNNLRNFENLVRDNTEALLDLNYN